MQPVWSPAIHNPLKQPQVRAAGFTLVELLMLLAVICILGALFLPLLQNTLEQSRRVSCLSNLNQQSIGIMAYVGDNKGLIPPYALSPAALTQCLEASVISATVNYYSNLGSGPSANALFYKYGYWSAEIMNCPSMDCQLTLAPPEAVGIGFFVYGVQDAAKGPYRLGYTHYDYRYNIGGGCADYNPRALSSSKNTRRALCWDQAATNRAQYTLEPRASSIHESSGWYTGADITRRLKWAHQAGGNILRIDGSATWLANFYFPPTPRKSWPGGYDTWNAFDPVEIDKQ